MKTRTKKFGLRHKEKDCVLGVARSSNVGSDCCGETQHILRTSSTEWWLVDDVQNAEWVRFNSTEWYNAEYDSPTHDYDPEELEVVSIVVETNVAPVKVKIPTPREYFKKRYAKDPRHWKYLEGLMDSGVEIKYSWADLKVARGDYEKKQDPTKPKRKRKKSGKE